MKLALGIIRENLDRLDGFFAEYRESFDWVRPKAGPIAFPGFRRGSVETFCGELVRRSGVLLLPGTLYGEESNCFRIGFGRRNLPECLAQLAAFMRDFE